MAWLDDILDDKNFVNVEDKDRDIALNMLSASKAGVGMLSAAIVETTNPLLRQMLSTQLTAGISSHFQLSDMTIQNGWYNAFDEPKEQISSVSKETENIIQ